ncbi:pre-mRNA-processing factor 39 [Diaphorina citri]|uniref:Pre-mRNA-processing factor 39 n=1 Tax=Diaphorina citri TaxID=121845 RepID=A0A3Q0IS22_DIACI|nr:pre-mRNA-processing factor 39 [Diaphorina citri]
METDIGHNDGESLKAKAQENTNENPIENKPSDSVSENQPETEEKEDASSEEQKDGVDDEKGVESNEIISKDIENNEDVLGDKIEENVEEDNEIPAEKRNEESLEEKVDDEKSAENDGNEKTVDDKTGSKNSAEDKDNEGDTVGSSQVTKENGNAGPVIKSSKDTVPELEEEPLNGKPNVGRPTLNLTAKTKIKLNKLQKEDDDDEDIIEVPVIKPKIDVIDVPDEEIGDTEVVSEDELPPPPTKEKVDGAEEVSDEELPAAPKPDLPPEAEDVSDEELAEPLEKKKKLDVKIEPAFFSRAASRSVALTNYANKKFPTIGTRWVYNARLIKVLEEQHVELKALLEDMSNSTILDRETSATAKGFLNFISEQEFRFLLRIFAQIMPRAEILFETLQKTSKDVAFCSRQVDQFLNDVEKVREAVPSIWEEINDHPDDTPARQEFYHYPYCYGYWRKYADYEKKKGTQDKCEEVFVQGLKAIPLSVDLWIHFLNYIKSVYAVDPDYVRQQYKASVDTCGLEFRADRLWDSYIKWEISQKELVKAREVFDRVLSIPLQGHTAHFESFQNFVGSYSPKDILPVDEFLTIRMEVLPSLKKSKDSPMLGGDDKPPGDDNIPPGEETESTVLDADEANAIKEKIVAARRKVHKETASAVAERWSFEEGIKRPYFHVKALEKCQLKNWKDYLDFEISKGNEERILVLFERCLIACALYEEFWYKYICYLVDKPTPDVEKIREIYIRACTIHHPKKVNLHFEWAAFEEKYGYPDKAREILEKIEKEHIKLIEIPLRRIALEKRTKQPDTVDKLYEKYLNQWKDEELARNYFDLAIKYARYSALEVEVEVEVLDE